MIWDLFGDVCVHHLWLEMKVQPQWSMFISQVAFFPLFNQDCDFCFAVPDDLDVALWDIHGNAIARLRAHQQRVLRCAWSPNGHWLASASADRIRLWKISAFKQSEPRGPRHEIMNSSPSHSPLVVDASHRILKVSFPGQAQDILRDVMHMDFSGLGLCVFGQYSAVAFSLDGDEQWWSFHADIIESGLLVRKRGLGSASVTCGAFPPISTVVDNSPPSFSRTSNAHDPYCVVGLDDGTVWKSQMTSNLHAEPHRFTSTTRPYLLYRHDGRVTSIHFSSDGTFLLSTSVDMTIKVLAAPESSFSLSMTLAGHESYVNTACFSPAETLIASASEDNTVRLWSTEDWSCVKVFTEHQFMVSHVAFSHDGRVVVSGDRGGRICRHTVPNSFSSSHHNRNTREDELRRDVGRKEDELGYNSGGNSLGEEDWFSAAPSHVHSTCPTSGSS